MEPDEVLVEIERRKKRAADLRIRDVLWSLYNSHLGRYESWSKEDPQLVYPGIGKTVNISGKEIQFSVGRTVHRLIYREGSVASNYSRMRVSGSRDDPFEEKIVPGTLTLRVEEEKVFKFEISTRTCYGPDGPVTDHPLGEVTRFIDGLWVMEIIDLWEKIRAHEENVRQERRGPREARALEALKKRFGL